VPGGDRWYAIDTGSQRRASHLFEEKVGTIYDYMALRGDDGRGSTWKKNLGQNCKSGSI